jgi:hypothetical protein
MFPHLLMMPLFCYYGFWGVQALMCEVDSLFNKATISLCMGKRDRYTETI